MDTNPAVVNPTAPTTQPIVENGTLPQGTQLPVAPTVTVPGSHTDSALLLKSLQEEREKRRLLEEELEKTRSLPSGEAFSDEGKLLEKKIKDLESTIVDIKNSESKRELQGVHPILKEKWSDFESFRELPDNKGMNMRTAAKAFLIENGQMDTPRPGLENPTGGPRLPVTPAMSAEDVKELREKDPRKYREMLEKGQIKI